MHYKYIIDTDIGDDIDDAFAIAQALDYNLDVIGVTTVFKNVKQRAAIARKLLKLYGRSDIPVYAGVGVGINGKLRTTDKLIQYTSDLPEYYVDKDDCEELAVDFIINKVKDHGESLVILAIGPLTNIARAIQKAPEIMAKVGKILLMGGDYSRQYCEWNIICDLDAAKIVFTSDCKLECVGYDVTVQTRMKNGEEKKVLDMFTENKPEKAYLKELYTLWRKGVHEKTVLELHDPLTVYYEINPAAFKMKTSGVYIATDCGKLNGMTVNAEVFCKNLMSKQVLFAVSADIELFKKQFFEITCSIK